MKNYSNRKYTATNQKIFKLSSLLFLAAALTSCGGGGGSNNPVANNFFPEKDDNAVEPDATVRATFNRDMFAITLTDTNFTLKTSSDDDVAAGVNYDVASKTVSLIPDSDLALLKSYTANLKPTITDLDGNALVDTLWQFTVRDGSWQGVGIADANIRGSSFNPELVMDNNGNALALFKSTDDTLYANRYTPENGWDRLQAIEPVATGDSRDHQIVMDSNGNALAVWRKFDGTRFNIWSNRYTPGNGWETAQVIELNNVISSSSPQIAFDNSGNALVVWSQATVLKFNRYTIANNMWGVAGTIEIGATGNTRSPQIAIDNKGNVLVVWRDVRSIRSHIWSNHYTPENGWGTTPQQIESNSGSAFNPQITFDDDGNALAVWEQLNTSGTVTDIWSNRYTPENGWETALLVETNDVGNANWPQLAIDSDGNALVVWQQDDRLEGEADVRSDIWFNKYTFSSGWGTAQLIETNDNGSASRPQIALDNGDNGLAVWSQDDGSNDNIWSNRYLSNSDWGVEQLIETENEGTAKSQKIAVNSKGRAMAVWQQTDDSRLVTEIKSNSFR